MLHTMTYTDQRKDRIYVAAHYGIDALTGKGRRRWHTVGDDLGCTGCVGARPDCIGGIEAR